MITLKEFVLTVGAGVILAPFVLLVMATVHELCQRWRE